MTNGEENVPRCLARTALFLAGLAAVLAGLYAAGYRRYHVGDYAQPDAIFAAAPRFEYAVLGSSHARGVRLDKMGYKGGSFAVNGQDMFEVSYKARAIAPRLVGHKVVFVSVSYFTFVYDNAAYLEKGVATRAERRLDMYAAFPRLSFVDGDLENYFKGVLHPIVTMDHWRRVLARDGAGSAGGAGGAGGADADDDDEPKKVAEKKQTDASLKKLAHRRCAEYAGIVRNMLKNHPDVSADVLEETEAMVARLRGYGARVVFFTSPFYNAYSACFRAAWKKNMADNMRTLVRDTRVEYYDHSNDAAFAADPKMFRNSDHLSWAGVTKFSQALKRDVEGGRI